MFSADVFLKCSFVVQDLCVGAVVVSVSVWVRVYVCFSAALANVVMVIA